MNSHIDGSSTMSLKGPYSRNREFAVNIFRGYFRGSSADYSFHFQNLGVSAVGVSCGEGGAASPWVSTGQLHESSMMNRFMNIFRADLPRIFRGSSAVLPRCKRNAMYSYGVKIMFVTFQHSLCPGLFSTVIYIYIYTLLSGSMYIPARGG